MSVEVANWQVRRGLTSMDSPPPTDEISREYRFFGPRTSDPPAIFRIVCELESAGDGISINRRLRFYLRPFRLPHEAPFVLRLHTADRTEGGEFDVLAAPVDGDQDMAVFTKFGGRNDVATCLKTMMAGRDMFFMLADETENLVKLPLPNDLEFKRLYDETCQRLAEVDAMSETLRSQKSAQRPGPTALPSNNLPPHFGNIWLEGEEIWFTWPTIDATREGRTYHVPGGAICLPRTDVGRAELLKILRSHRDMWAPGNEAKLAQVAARSK